LALPKEKKVKTTTTILVSLVMLYATACDDKPAKQPAQANQEAATAPPDTTVDSIQTINETCLIFIAPETKEFEDENSDEAQAYYEGMSGFGWYMAQARTQFERTGIKDIITEKRYLSFTLDKAPLHNSRSTAISLLINKGVPESVTQELANHSDPKTTARYYRQIDDSKKREALAKIPVF